MVIEMANSLPTAAEIAAKIRYLHEAAFAGKPRGRFKIDDESMKVLSGRSRLLEATFEDIKSACAEDGLMVTRLKHHGIFTVMETKKMVAWRNVPSKLLIKLEQEWEWDE